MPYNPGSSGGPGLYNPTDGWVQSPFWEEYANAFASDGSEEQLLAALTHSTPREWLEKFYSSHNVTNDIGKQWMNQNAGNYITNTASKPVSRLQDTNQVISNYSKAMQKRLASDFNKNFGSTLDKGKASLRQQAQQGLDDEFGTIDENANSRGLLYSGKRQSARANAAAQKASDLGDATSQYERQLNDTRRDLNSGAINMDINTMFQQQDLNSIASGAFYEKMKQDLADSANQLDSLSNLGYGTGSGMGGAAAQKKK